jgi:hypothetical protein
MPERFDPYGETIFGDFDEDSPCYEDPSEIDKMIEEELRNAKPRRRRKK